MLGGGIAVVVVGERSWGNERVWTVCGRETRSSRLREGVVGVYFEEVGVWMGTGDRRRVGGGVGCMVLEGLERVYTVVKL